MMSEIFIYPQKDNLKLITTNMFTLIVLLISLVMFFLLFSFVILGMDKGLEERDEAIKFIKDVERLRYKHNLKTSNENIKNEEK